MNLTYLNLNPKNNSNPTTYWTSHLTISSSSVRLRLDTLGELDKFGDILKYLDAKPFRTLSSFIYVSSSFFCLITSLDKWFIFDCWSSTILRSSLMQLWLFNSSLAISILQPRLQMIGFLGLYSHSCRWLFKFSSRKIAGHPYAT